MFAKKIETMYERSLASVKVEPRSTSCLSSVLFILPLFYLCDENLRALTCVAKNALVEINLKGVITWRISVPAAISARLAGLRFQSGFRRKSS